MRFFTLTELAARLEAELHGSGDIQVSGIKPLAEAEPGTLTFYAPTSKKASKELYDAARTTRAAAILIPEYDPQITTPQLIVPHPLRAVSELTALFFTPGAVHSGIHPKAVVAGSANIAPGVSVGAFSVIGEEVEIAEGCIIHPHVVIYDRARIGKNCVIHAGAIIREDVILGDDCLIQNGVVLGGDGFGYFPDAKLGHRRLPHIGSVVLGNRVDVGANSTIDRGMLGDTKLGEATKVDNLVMIGHNCRIGMRTLICGMAGISGSVRIGDDVILGGGTGVADHLIIGDRVRAAARSGITGNVAQDVDVGGYPHTEVRQWRRQIAMLRKLPEMLRDGRIAPKLSVAGNKDQEESSEETRW